MPLMFTYILQLLFNGIKINFCCIVVKFHLIADFHHNVKDSAVQLINCIFHNLFKRAVGIACHMHNKIFLIYLSTEFVFIGKKAPAISGCLPHLIPNGFIIQWYIVLLKKFFKRCFIFIFFHSNSSVCLNFL